MIDPKENVLTRNCVHNPLTPKLFGLKGRLLPRFFYSAVLTPAIVKIKLKSTNLDNLNVTIVSTSIFWFFDFLNLYRWNYLEV